MEVDQDRATNDGTADGMAAELAALKEELEKVKAERDALASKSAANSPRAKSSRVHAL